jgi:integrase
MIRPGNLQQAEWKHFDLDAALWIIPADDMKMKTHDHLVPLSKQVVELLRGLHVITGSGRYVFPNQKTADKPISHNCFNEAFRYMGFSGDQIVAHGFRATARTMLQEILGCEPDVIEAQLAHAVPDRLGTAYNRTKFIEQRKAMLQRWSDYLDELKQS